MNDYLFLMHGDQAEPSVSSVTDEWGPYLRKLQELGCFRGGSSVGNGACFNKTGKTVAIGEHIVGYIKVEAVSIDQAREYLAGNPVYEAGGTVEIRELPRD